MNDIGFPLSWVGLAVAVVAVFVLLEFVLRMLTNRYGTPQDGYRNRTGSQYPR